MSGTGNSQGIKVYTAVEAAEMEKRSPTIVVERDRSSTVLIPRRINSA